MAADDWGFRERVELAGKSYAEVLDATKHQDDKIGRFLTAIAFLFTGAITFGTRSDFIGRAVDLGGREWRIPLALLGGFLVFSLIAVLLLAVALGPNLTLPHPEGGGPPSRLFFLSIAGMDREEWRSMWRYPAPATHEILQMFLDESHNLATKTDFKYSRTNEARAAFTFALLLLALAIGLSFEGAVRFGPSDTRPIPWDSTSRTLVATIVGIFAFVLAYDYLRLEQTLPRYKRRLDAWMRVRALYLLVLAAPLLTSAMIVPMSTRSRALGADLVVMAAAAGGLGLVLRAKMGTSLASWAWRICIAAGAFVLGLIGRTALLDGRPEHRLYVALLTIVLLELPRLLVSTYWLKRRLSRRLPQEVATR